MKKSRQVIFMFPGMGTQYYNMGSELYEKNRTFRQKMHQLNDIVVDSLGISIIDSIYDPKKGEHDILDDPQISCLAILMIEYSLVQVLKEEGIKPDFLLGGSLGEFTSLSLSGIFNIEELLITFYNSLEIFKRNSPRGSMLGIMENVSLYENNPEINKNSEIAVFSYDKHFVISGTQEKIDSIKSFIKKNSVSFQDIPTTMPSHSSLVDPAEPEIKKLFSVLDDSKIINDDVKLISCAAADVINTIDTDFVWNIFRKPINFQKTIEQLEKSGDHIYIDLGPGGTLATFAGLNLKGGSASKCFQIITPQGNEMEKLDELIGHLLN
ncbi:acyltransferase domain-containing protein [Spirochaetota bacterium]